MDVIKGSVKEAATAIEGMLAPQDTQPPEGKPTENLTESVVEEVSAENNEPTEAEAPAQAQEEQVYTVKVDGEEVPVTLDELLKGYSRTSYFHKKLSEIDRIKKEIEAEQMSVKEEREHLAQLLPQLKAELEKGEPEPNWEQLFKEDPIEFVRQEAIWRQRKEKKERLLQEQARLVQSQQIEQQKLIAHKVKEESERLMAAIPDLKNPDTASKDKAAILEYGLSLGYTEAEMGQIFDHRAVLLFHKARQFDEAQTKVKGLQAKPGAVKTAKAGNLPPQKNTGFEKQYKNFKANPTLRNAAGAIERLISR